MTSDAAAPTITADSPFSTVADRIRAHARLRPRGPALADGHEALDHAALDARMDRVAAALQRDGIGPGESIAVSGANSVRHAVLFLGALRAGVVVAPIAPSVPVDSFAAMLADAGPRALFIDRAARSLVPAGWTGPCIALDAEAGVGPQEPAPFDDWLAPAGASPKPVAVQPDWAFNIIYSSGTTGTPKGIVQSHGMRWTHVRRGLSYGYGPDSRTLLSTPLYSNTTLVAFFPTLAFGGAVHLMARFDAARWLQIAESERITHTMLVPVQYQRLMAHPDFDRHDLSAFRMKGCTSAPFPAALKADVLRRWPGGLIETYGLTEGGGTCILEAHKHPDKLHTVGRPVAGHDIRLIDEAGRELPPGSTGEVVGHSPGMMTGYHRQPEKTREAEWFDAQGKRFIRTGDVGRFDADGFLVLMDRRKDMIITGGFNVYPSDLEAALRGHPAVADAAVIGMPSARWGETPVAWVVRRAGDGTPEQAVLDWYNGRAGKTQRLAALAYIDELPRSGIGKVLKRELREQWTLPVA